MYPFLVSSLIALALQFVVGAIQGVYWLKIQGKLAITANAGFLWHVLRLPMEFYSQRSIGDIASRQSSNEGIASRLIGQIAPVFLNVALLAFYLAVMLRYSPLLSAVGILTALVNMVITRD